MERMISSLLSDYESGKMSRRQFVQTLAIASVAAPAATSLAADAPRHFKAQTINHISYGVADYAKTRDFYVDLLGMKVVQDNGKQALMKFGDSLLIARKTQEPSGKPYVDHICYTLADWDEKAVKDELERRGLKPKLDTGGGQNTFHVQDPDGYDLQIGGPLVL